MSREKQDVTKISFNVNNEQLKLLQQYAKSHRMTFTATMEYAIEVFLKEKDSELKGSLKKENDSERKKD